MAYYEPRFGGIPGWGRTLLLTSLKRGQIYRVRLDAAGTAVVGQAEAILRTQNRYRDLVVDHNGRSLYVATDASDRGRRHADYRPREPRRNPGVSIHRFSVAHQSRGGPHRRVRVGQRAAATSSC